MKTLNRRSFVSTMTVGAALLPVAARAQDPTGAGVSPPGADPEGTRDSSEAFQHAVDALSARGGGTIRVPAGKFLINHPIDLRRRRGIRFVGASSGAGGDDGSRLYVTQSGVNVFEMEQSKGILFQNLHLLRDAAIRSAPGDGFHALDQTSDCRFIDCTVTFFYHGAFLQDSWQNYFRGCLLHFCEIGAKVDTSGGLSNDTKFQQCLIAQCNVHELEINANTVYVVGCDFESATSEWGIFGRFGSDCVIANCSFIRGIMLGLERARVIGNGLVGA